MKNNPRTLFVMAVFCIASACAVSAFGQIRTGGYRNISVSDAGVKAAAEFAVETKANESEQELSLEGIVKAEAQTVAGTNYRLCLQVYTPSEEDETDGVSQFIKTVIFKSLKGEYKITSWEEDDFGEK